MTAPSVTPGAGVGDPSAFSMLEVLVQRTRDGVTRLFNESDFIRVGLVSNMAGVRTLLDSVVFATADWAGPFATTMKVLVHDNQNDSPPANTVTISHNGVTMAVLDASSFAGPDSWRCGLLFNGNSDGTSKPCRAVGGRLVDPPSQGVQTPGIGRPDFVAFGENAVWSGVLGEDQLLTVYAQGNHDNTNLETGQVGLYGRYVQAFTKLVTFDDESSTEATRNRVFATDGREADIHCHVLLDPIERKVYEWDITKGGAATDLLGFKLCCNHGPSVLIAAPETNGSLWALSAKVDRTGVYSWQNFDPSDATIATVSDRAIVGTASGQGLPADDIIALIPIPSDEARYETLLMGSRSIWSLRGDPRVDGGLSNVSASTGILGPSAWCFDNKGNLWWVGNGGLHAMPKGSRSYTKTDGRRMPEWFELADVFRRQLILRYRASDNTILCYLSPRVGGPDEGQPSRVAVYDIEAQEFTPDEYAVDVGPTTVVEITGQKPEDRDVVLCGYDGRIYRYSDTAYSDNGDPIDVVIDTRTVEDARGGILKCDLLDVVAAKGTGPVELSWYAAESGVEAQEFEIGEYEGATLAGQDDPYLSSTLFAAKSGGRQQLGLGVAAPAHRVVLRQRSATQTVAIEQLRGQFSRVGEARI